MSAVTVNVTQPAAVAVAVSSNPLTVTVTPPPGVTVTTTEAEIDVNVTAGAAVAVTLNNAQAVSVTVDQTAITATVTDGIPDAPADGTIYGRKNNGWIETEAGAGDVVGPASATDSNFAAFDTTTGKLIKDSGSKAADFQPAGSYLTSESDPITGAVNGIVKADGIGNISAASPGTDYQGPLTADVDYLTPGTAASTYQPAGAYLTSESDPVTGAINGIVKADGAGNISAAQAGTDYQAPLTAGVDYLAPAGDGSALSGVVHAETDPAVGAVTGIIKADGLGNISAAVNGTDYETAGAAATVQGNLDTHTGNTSNPHSVTLAQVGGTTDHTALTNIGTNAHTAIDSHIASTANPHSVTAAQAGALASNADYSNISGNDAATDVTGAELETLTDGSDADSLHTHSGLTVAEANANDIFRCDSPGGTSAFVGTIATLPGGATLTYNITSGNEGAMVPVSTSHLAKMRLYNTTRSTSALISNCVAATNTLTLTANVPAGWQVGDTIDIASQTVSGGTFTWVDFEITSGPMGKSGLFLFCTLVPSAANETLRTHPFETFGAGKVQTVTAPAVGNTNGFMLVKIVNDVFSVAWAGTPSVVLLREAGYLG